MPPLPDALLAMPEVPSAGRGAQRRHLVDHQLLAAVGFLDGAAHRSAGPVHGQRERQVAEGVPRRDAQPQIPVLDVQLAPLVEATDVQQYGAGNDDREREDVNLTVEQRAERRRRRIGRVVERYGVDGLEERLRGRRTDERGRVQEAGRRVSLEIGELKLELSRQPHIVGVQERDEPAARPRDACVARAAGAKILLMQLHDLMGPVVNAQRRIVGRAIVDDDHLEVLVGLIEDRFERSRNRTAGVVRWNDDRHLWH